MLFKWVRNWKARKGTQEIEDANPEMGEEERNRARSMELLKRSEQALTEYIRNYSEQNKLVEEGKMSDPTEVSGKRRGRERNRVYDHEYPHRGNRF